MQLASSRAPGDNPEARKLESVPAFDWLRMALAMIVALGHSGVVFPAPIDGHFAVEVFLALSGWLIGGILIRSTGTDLPRFFYNRATRIWLPYLAAIILLYGFALIREGFSLFWLKYLFYDATFTHLNFVTFPRASTEMPLGGSGNQFWSLSVEEQFYLFTPILIMYMPLGRKALTWIGLGIAALMLQSVVAPITLGVVAAMLQRDHGDWHLGRTTWPLVLAITLALAGAAHFWDLPALRSLLAAGIVLCLAIPGRRGAVGVFFGALSYPFYLNHWIGGYVVHGIAKRFAMPPPVFVVLALALAFVISVIAWWLIDRPLMKWRSGWYRPRLGKGLAIAAYALVLSGLIGGFVIARMGG